MNNKDFLLSINPTKIKFGLKRTEAFLKACSNPHKKLYSIQIIGTNGKGSTSAMMTHTLHKHNIKVGHFTSPHLVDFKERIKINNEYIDNKYVDNFIEKYKKYIIDIGVSFFEIMSVMAIKYFADHKVDVAILETGLGGRLDSITAMESVGLIITSISMDHMNILGNNLELIAQEKAGAITNHTHWIVSTIQDAIVTNILKKKATIKNCEVQYIPSDFYFALSDSCKYLPGEHQIANANLAFAGIKMIWKKIHNSSFSLCNTKLILETFWPGRIQKIQLDPDIIFDVAHNTQGIQAFIKYFDNHNVKYDKKYLIVGFESTKDISNIINDLIVRFDSIIITETQVKSSMTAQLLYQEAKHKDKVTINVDAYESIIKIKNIMKENDILVILGSHYFGNTLNKIFKNCFDNQYKT